MFVYLLPDGKQVDPKLIRVIPIIKKVSNAVPKPPSPTYVKRIGCSWSAFRGKLYLHANIIMYRFIYD